MKELSADPIKFMALLAVTIGAIAMLRSVIVKDGRVDALWVRQATALCAVFFLLWCVGSFLVTFAQSSIPPKLVSLIMYLKTAIGGMGAGIMLTLFMSGSLSRRGPRTKDEQR